MKIVVCGSGSKGNASFVSSGDTLIQIDMGLPLCRIAPELDKLGKKIEDISALLLTHDHRDHIGTVELYHGAVPIYCGEGTWRDTPANHLKPWTPFMVGSLNIVPFSTYHDATNPMGFLIEGDHERLCWITDTGVLDEDILKLIQDCDYYYMESNHDLKMLRKSKRPAILKDRIASDHGHLNNIDSAIYMCEAIGPHTKAIYLAHISEECNTPEIAIKSYEKTFKRRGVSLDEIKLVCCAQWEPTYGGDL